MTTFYPNNFGRLVFLIICIISFFGMNNLFKSIKTDYIVIDFSMLIFLYLTFSYIVSKLIWIILNKFK